jgi:hypothetical protein
VKRKKLIAGIQHRNVYLPNLTPQFSLLKALKCVTNLEMVTEFTNSVVMLYFLTAIKVKLFLSSRSAAVYCENLCRIYNPWEAAGLSDKLFYY